MSPTKAIAADAAASAAETGLGAPDRDFIDKAAQGGQMEVLAGKLAAQRGLSLAVKEFGEKMVADHTAANDRLKSLADSKQHALLDSVSPEQHKSLGQLEGLIGAEFDKAYSKMMVADHVEDIKDFEKEANKGKDADVKAFAEQTLPTLRHHLMLANRLSAEEQKNSGGRSRAQSSR